MMSTQTDRLLKLGLSKDEINVYLYLIVNSKQSVLKISREIKLGRTKVYRVLDRLYKLGLVEQEVGYRGFVFSATPFDSLKSLVFEKETEVEQLKVSLPKLVAELTALAKLPQENQEYKVIYYRGNEGLKQVNWNSGKAKRNILIYSGGGMTGVTDDHLAERIREQHIKNDAYICELVNDKRWEGFSNHKKYIAEHWEPRYVSPKDLKIEVETLIYNDIVTMYHIDEGEPFCVEIHNERLASQQRQIFEFVWKNAKKMKKVGDRGAAVLK